MNHIYKILFFFNLILLITGNTDETLAYFKPAAQTELPVIQRDLNDFQKDRFHKPGLLVLYNNQEYARIKESGSPLILPSSPGIIPMDRIDSNIPLPIIYKAIHSEKNTMAGFLYANLKLNIMLKEYMELQERVQKMLSTGKIDSSKPRSKAGETGGSVFHQSSRIKTEVLHLAKLKHARISPPVSQDVNGHTLNQAETFKRKKAVMPIIETGILVQRDIPREKTASANSSSSRSVSPYPAHTEDLPWAFEKLFRALDYINTNRKSIAGACTFFIAAVSIISLLKKNIAN